MAQRRFQTFFSTWLTLALSFFIALSATQTAQAAPDLLDVDEAFVLHTPEVDGNTILVRWTMAEGYHLYKQKMEFKSNEITFSQIEKTPAERVNDPIFGETEIYKNEAKATLHFSPVEKSQQITLSVKYQGCATALGVCYPPQTRDFTLSLPASASNEQKEGVFSSLSALNNFFQSSSSQPTLLDAEEAFKFSHQIENGQLTFLWQIADDYHLYQDKFKIAVLKGDAKVGQLALPPAERVDDPVFGKTDVFHGNLQATLPIGNLNGSATIEVEYQGCSVSAGVCYPPTKKQIEVNASQITSVADIANTNNNTATDLSESDQIADTLKNSNIWVVIATFFLFGLLLSFTPCVFPMIPILSSIIVGQGVHLTHRRAFIMSLVYVLAMSVTYTVAGVLAGLFGENLQATFQNPWIIATFSFIFVLLSLSMFGFYDIQLPARWQSKLTHLSNTQKGGTLTGVAIMGLLSALIVGPCVAPPLAGALIYIGQTGDAALGGIALFAMSMGMGIPLLAIGTTSAHFLPKAGAWMDNIKAVFGVMLIGVAIWMLERIVPAEITMINWALLFIVSAVYLGAFEASHDKSGWFKLAKGLGIALFLYGFMILIGLLGGSKDVLQPLKTFQGSVIASSEASEELKFKKIKSIEDLERELAKGNPVMLDFYADWCISCKEMEKFTFSDRSVQNALKNVTLVKADVTANDAIDKALLQKFGLIGPPAILFFDSNGQEQKAQRVIGFKPADQFLQNIQAAY